MAAEPEPTRGGAARPATLPGDRRRGAEPLWQTVVEELATLRATLSRTDSHTARRVVETELRLASDQLPDPRPQVAVERCRDGWVAIQAPTPRHREFLAAAAGRPGPDERWREWVGQWCGASEVPAVCAELADWGVPAWPVPAIVRTPTEPVPAERLDLPDLEEGGAVIELGGLWAAPYAGRLLADRGLPVTKVEMPSRPDGLRQGASGLYRWLNRGKTVLELDLRRPRDRDRLLGQLGPRTVVIENFTARVLANLELGPDLIQARGGALVRLPASRREPDRRALGSTVELAGGLGLPDREGRPACAPLPFTDPLAGARAAVAAIERLAAGGGTTTVGQIEDVAAPLALRLAGERP